MKVRTNEKKYHTELVNIANDDVGGWGFKAQRGFVGGMPDVELKTPLLPLVKVEIKHEVFANMPKRVSVNMTELQRMRLRKMQSANLSCGWAVFITVARNTWVVYGSDPDAQSFTIEAIPGKHYVPKPTNDHYMEMQEWTKGQKIAVFSKMLNLLTRPQLYSHREEPITETSPTTPTLLNI